MPVTPEQGILHVLLVCGTSADRRFKFWTDVTVPRILTLKAKRTTQFWAMWYEQNTIVIKKKKKRRKFAKGGDHRYY